MVEGKLPELYFFYFVKIFKSFFVFFQSIDNCFAQCLSASNFDSLSKMKQLLGLLLSRKLNGSFDEATYVGHLFDESRKKLGLSTEETEELFAIEIIYNMERNSLDQVISLLGICI